MIQFAQADGYKKPTEDRVLVGTLKNGNTLLAIFDGHGGHQVAEISKNVFTEFIDDPAFDTDSLKAYLAHLDHRLHKYKNIGSTASIVIITPTHVVGAYLGDSPIMIFTPEGRVLHSTKDHHPTNPEEKARVESMGGVITQRGGDVARIGGVLALSRALGDHGLKPAVSADPDLFSWKRPTRGFLAIASDGMLEMPSGETRSRPALARLIIDGRLDTSAIVAEQERLMDFAGDNLSLILADISVHRRQRTRKTSRA